MDRFHRLYLTEGERGAAFAYLVASLFCAAAAYLIVNHLNGGSEILHALGPYELWSILAGMAGGGAALYLLRHRLGQPGGAGIARAGLAMLVWPFIAAAIGGTLALPFYGTMFGPLIVGLVLAQSPVLVVMLMILATACHLLFAQWRRERDSIFAVPPDDGIPV